MKNLRTLFLGVALICAGASQAQSRPQAESTLTKHQEYRWTDESRAIGQFAPTELKTANFNKELATTLLSFWLGNVGGAYWSARLF